MIEETLIAECLQGNPIAQRALYEQYSPRMMAVCFRYAHSREDAEDMLQEGFIRVYSQLSSFKGNGSFEGWIRRIVVNTCINVLKKNKKFDEVVDLEQAYDASVKETVHSVIQAKQVTECIRLLPTGYRTVLNLFAIEGYSHKEIGAMLDIGESTSRSQYTRAKALLEQILIDKKVVQQPAASQEMLPAYR